MKKYNRPFRAFGPKSVPWKSFNDSNSDSSTPSYSSDEPLAWRLKGLASWVKDRFKSNKIKLYLQKAVKIHSRKRTGKTGHYLPLVESEPTVSRANDTIVLIKCPFCVALVRSDRLEKHIFRLHHKNISGHNW
jgi:hypothetical protein